jgi:hypothetical protein
MIKTTDVQKGTLVEVLTTDSLMTLGPGEPGGMAFNPLATAYPMLTGEQYEFTGEVRKSRHSSSKVACLKQVGGPKEGMVFWEFVRKNLRLVSGAAPVIEDRPDSSMALNTGEEYVLVSKTDPTLFFKNIDTHRYQVEAHAKDSRVGDLLFNPLPSQRKTLKNKQVLFGVLHRLSNVLDAEAWPILRKDPKTLSLSDKASYMHLQNLASLPYWMAGPGLQDLSDLSRIELRKYNTRTKTLSGTALPFDCETVARRFVATMTLVEHFGSGVAHLAGALCQENKADSHPWLFSAMFDPDGPHGIREHLWGEPENTGKGKDIALDLALKRAGLKKKDIPHYNENGYVAVAFDNEKDRAAFAAAFSNPEKTTVLLDLAGVFGQTGVSRELLAKKVETDVVPPASVAGNETPPVNEPMTPAVAPPVPTPAPPVVLAEPAQTNPMPDGEGMPLHGPASTADCKALLDTDPLVREAGGKGPWSRLSKKNTSDGIERVFAGKNGVLARVLEANDTLRVDRVGKTVEAVSGPVPTVRKPGGP